MDTNEIKKTIKETLAPYWGVEKIKIIGGNPRHTLRWARSYDKAIVWMNIPYMRAMPDELIREIMDNARYTIEHPDEECPVPSPELMKFIEANRDNYTKGRSDIWWYTKRDEFMGVAGPMMY